MMPGFPELVYKPARADPEAIEIPPNANSLDLLRAIYRSTALPLTTRMRAAMAALKHEVPALLATAIINERDFAAVLDRRIAHYEQLQRQTKLIHVAPAATNGNATNGNTVGAKENGGNQVDARLPPPAPDRRFRRRY